MMNKRVNVALTMNELLIGMYLHQTKKMVLLVPIHTSKGAGSFSLLTEFLVNICKLHSKYRDFYHDYSGFRNALCRFSSQTRNLMNTDDQRPPFFSSWKYLYGLVLVTLAVFIILFYWLTQTYA